MSIESNAVAFNTIFVINTQPSDTKITQLAQWGKSFYSMGLVQGMEGNLSFRTQLGFIISGTGIPLNALTQETVAEVTGVVYGLARNSVYVKGQVVPSRESILHSQIYEERSDINAIFHVHDSVLTRQAEKLGIPITGEEKEAGSRELAEEAVKLLKYSGDLNYFVLRNHGIVALGTTMDEAGRLIEGMSKKVQS